VPNPFFGGVLFPSVVLALLYALPWLAGASSAGDYRRHDLLEFPRDNPRRTALAAAVFTAVAIVFAAGSADRLFFQFGFGYEGAIWFFRAAFVLLPIAVFVLAKRICLLLAREQAHRLRGWHGTGVAQPTRRLRKRLAAAARHGPLELALVHARAALDAELARLFVELLARAPARPAFTRAQPSAAAR
jgi:hypothetical protein